MISSSPGLPQDAVRLRQRGRVPSPRGESPPPLYERDLPLPLDRGVPLRDGRDAMRTTGSASRFSTPRARSNIPMTALPVSKTMSPRLSPAAERAGNRERELQRTQKPRIRTRAQFPPWLTFLAMTLAALNLLAFAWHTVLELLEPPWLAAREAAVKPIRFFAHSHAYASFRPRGLPRILLNPA